VSRNVAKLSLLPKKAAGNDDSLEVVPLTADEAKQFLEAIRGHRLETLYTVALALGLRHGEALGLQWPDFDAETATLRVFYQLQAVDGKLERVPTKSAKSRRLIHLPAICVAALDAHRERQETERAFAGENWKESGGYIFTSRIGTPLRERNVLRDFSGLLEAAGLPKRRMHDLRHTCISLLGAQGVPLKTISEIVGHTDVRLTSHAYLHVFSEEKKAAANAIDRLLG
jgi:integrase